MVDSHVITHLSGGLVPGLIFSPEGNTAEHAHSSKLVKIRPEAGDRYSPGAAKGIRFRLVDDGWLTSVRLQVALNNLTKNAGGTQGVAITPISTPLAMFTSCRLFLGARSPNTSTSGDHLLRV